MGEGSFIHRTSAALFSIAAFALKILLRPRTSAIVRSDGCSAKMTQGMRSMDCVLRVGRRPYLTYSIFGLPGLCLCAAGVIFAPEEHSRSGYIIALLILAASLGYLFAAFLLYRVSLTEGNLVDSGLFKRTKTVSVDAIIRLKMETGWGSQKWFWAPTLRPFRRVAIYYRDGNDTKFLDISLNHFPILEVRQFISDLRELRPDLQVPRGLRPQ